MINPGFQPNDLQETGIIFSTRLTQAAHEISVGCNQMDLALPEPEILMSRRAFPL